LKEEKRTCIKCGKEIKGEGYSKLGKFYCCDKCCHIKKTPNMCEFC